MDAHVLSLALADLSEDVRRYIYRSIAKKTAVLIKDEVATAEATGTESQKREAREMFFTIFDRINEEMKDFDPALIQVKEMPEIRVSEKREIVDTMFGLAEVARAQGLLALEDVSDSDHRLLAKGIELIVGGWDPDIVIPILDRIKTTMVRETEDRLAMIIEAVVSIQAGDHPNAIRAKLEAYLSE